VRPAIDDVAAMSDEENGTGEFVGGDGLLDGRVRVGKIRLRFRSSRLRARRRARLGGAVRRAACGGGLSGGAGRRGSGAGPKERAAEYTEQNGSAPERAGLPEVVRHIPLCYNQPEMQGSTLIGVAPRFF